MSYSGNARMPSSALIATNANYGSEINNSFEINSFIDRNEFILPIMTNCIADRHIN